MHEDHRFNRQVSLNGCDAPPGLLVFKRTARSPHGLVDIINKGVSNPCLHKQTYEIQVSKKPKIIHPDYISPIHKCVYNLKLTVTLPSSN